MSLTEFDINKLSRLISSHVDQVTCIECCKYYMAPKTAMCGHTLCHVCWLGRKKCATCGVGVDRKSLKLNLILQKITEHTQSLRDECERLFKVKLDDFAIDTPFEKDSNKDPSKNVRDWLANSENQFSAPEVSQQATHDFTNHIHENTSKIQIHSDASQTISAKNTIHVKIPQDDWDKIEELPDTEEMHTKNKENAVGPIDIEPFVVDLFEFTTDNPRRSSRKRDIKGNTVQTNDINSVDQYSTKSNGTESKVLKNKQNWANVKRMKKEFSKLNKKSKNKLNVSIEMCKKTQIPAIKSIPVATVIESENLVLNIDDNTPNHDTSKECETLLRNVEKVTLPNNNLFKDESKVQRPLGFKTQLKQDTKQLVDHSKLLRNNLSNTTAVNNDQAPSVAFIMKGALQAPTIHENVNRCDNSNLQHITVNTDNVTKSSDDIEITIKIGNTLTNICIKKKEKDVQLKINSDREIQTSLEKCILHNKKNASCSPIKKIDPEFQHGQSNEHKTSQCVQKCLSSNEVISTTKTLSSKKKTDSADTATAQYEITESIQKELSKEMEKADVRDTQVTSIIKEKANTIKQINNDILDEDCLNDLDLFENDSVKEGNVQTLKSLNHATSEILISTLKSNRSKKQIDKRVRDTISDDLPVSKKIKIGQKTHESQEIINTSKTRETKKLDQDSEISNYDFIMDRVFANIDLDLGQKSDEGNVKNSQSIKTKKHKEKVGDSINGQSENVFSLLDKENDIVGQPPCRETQPRDENQKASSAEVIDDVVLTGQELSTPIQDNNCHSDESIVEETPQKDTSFHKVKQKSGGSLQAENVGKNKSLKLKRADSVNAQNKSSHTPNIMSVINLSDITDDTTRKSKQTTILEAPKCRPTLETPLTITNFVDQIKHKSTPMAKKSLNFDKENTEISDVDPDQTLCPNSFFVAKTTQEKEFMCMAFEDAPNTRARSPLTRNLKMKNLKYCLAGSCLTPSEMTNVKLLCSTRKWDYVDKYTKDLTHLVVGVDDENKSQRSVKYMCALAASKWIVSYEWVQKCLQMKSVINEEPFEALDNTGEPGPRRSRLAKQKLFQGFTFFCMPPFSVLDVDTLKEMLEAAGGCVVHEAKAVRVTSGSVALLLAEPEHTLEDRFIYLAMELSIVPVNSEWVLNCLGSYTISSVQELLLCPESLLPPATAQWPSELMAKEYD